MRSSPKCPAQPRAGGLQSRPARELGPRWASPEERKRVLSLRPFWAVVRWPGSPVVAAAVGLRADVRGVLSRVCAYAWGGFGRVSNDIAVTPWLTSRFRYLFHSQNCVDAYPTFLVVLWCAGLLCSQGEVLPSVCSLLSLTGAAVQAPRREAVPGLPLRSGKPWRGDRLRATCPAALCPPGGAVMRG